MEMIDLFDWDITHEEFEKWINDNNIKVGYINGDLYNVGPWTKFIFDNEEDLVAFKLKYSKDSNIEYMSIMSHPQNSFLSPIFIDSSLSSVTDDDLIIYSTYLSENYNTVVEIKLEKSDN